MASSLENNKILAAVLTAGIMASGAGVTSRILYHPTIPEEPAYVIDVPDEAGGGGGGDEGGEMSIAALLPAADVAGGESGAKKCVACHTFDDGGDNKIGPNLYGIVGRDIASVSGFAYSDALNDIEGTWDYDALDAFLAKPKDFAPGTKMAYAGMRSGEDRADLILYLRSLAPDPLPLPEAEVVETGAAEEAEGGEGEAEVAEEAAEETAEAAEDVADAAVEAADEVAEETEDAADAVAQAAGDVVEGAEETASEAAEAVADAADATAEAASDAADAAETAVEEASDAAAVSEAVEGAAEGTEEMVAAAGDAASDAATATEAAAGAAVGGLVALIAEGDVAKGEKVSKKCKACHVFEEGGKNKLGPALWGIVGRDIGSHEGFNYSGALSELEGDWNYEALDQFLAAPKTFAPGTKMVFAGLKKEQDRADLIAYLRTLDTEPAPLSE